MPWSLSPGAVRHCTPMIDDAHVHFFSPRFFATLARQRQATFHPRAAIPGVSSHGTTPDRTRRSRIAGCRSSIATAWRAPR